MTGDDVLIDAPELRATYVYQIRSPRSEWLEVSEQEYGRIKGIKGFDHRLLMVIESLEAG